MMRFGYEMLCFLILVCVHDRFNFVGNSSDGIGVGYEDIEVLVWENVGGCVDMFAFGGDAFDGPAGH